MKTRGKKQVPEPKQGIVILIVKLLILVVSVESIAMKTRGMETRGKKPVPEPKQGIVYKWFFQWSNILFFKIFGI